MMCPLIYNPNRKHRKQLNFHAFESNRKDMFATEDVKNMDGSVPGPYPEDEEGGHQDCMGNGRRLGGYGAKAAKTWKHRSPKRRERRSLVPPNTAIIATQLEKEVREAAQARIHLWLHTWIASSKGSTCSPFPHIHLRRLPRVRSSSELVERR